MIVAVTGQMRSGTSAVAEALHRLGCPVAMHTPAPQPPTWRFDWEDSKLSSRLMSRGVEAPWMRDYVAERYRHAAMCYDSTCIALKSPYLVFAKEALQIVSEMRDDPLFWVVLRRPQIDIDCSISQWEVLDPDVNKEIKAILAGSDKWANTITVDYDKLVENPKQGVSALALQLGLRPDPGGLEGAIATVKEPTSRSTEWQLS